MFNQIGDLEYTDVEAFCLTTWRYRELAFYYELWPYLVPNLEELTETLERKIKENNYADEAVQIAKQLLKVEQMLYFDAISFVV